MHISKTLARAIIVPCAVILLSSCVSDTRTPEQKAYSRAYNAFNKKQYPQVITQMRPLAEKGFKNADYFLGMSYLAARSPHGNSTEGLKWVEKAAERGYAKASMTMGTLFSDGTYLKKDFQKAAQWFRRSVKQGNKLGNVGLSRIQFLQQLENGSPKSRVPKHGCIWLVDRFAQKANVFTGTCSKDAPEAFQDFSERHTRRYARQKMRTGHWARIYSSGTKTRHRVLVQRYYRYSYSGFELSTRRVR